MHWIRPKRPLEIHKENKFTKQSVEIKASLLNMTWVGLTVLRYYNTDYILFCILLYLNINDNWSCFIFSGFFSSLQTLNK